MDGHETDDDSLSTTSSICLINADELNQPEVEQAVDSLTMMTQSQYAQVVFYDVEDSYPNDSDVVCRFTLFLSKPEDKAGFKLGDSVGIFRVPYIKPGDGLCFVTVSESSVSEGKGCVTFRTLPKEEDFYQFQYLRRSSASGDQMHTVLGASVPFQLNGAASATTKCPSEEDADLRESYSRLLELSENMTSQYEAKSLSFVKLEKDYERERSVLSQLKADMACLVQDKVLLEQRLEKNLEEGNALRTERDDWIGRFRTSEREKQMLRDENERLIVKLEERKAMVAAIHESKLLVSRLLNEHVTKEQKILEDAKKGNRFEDRLDELCMLVKSTDQTFGERFDSLAGDVASIKSCVSSKVSSQAASVASLELLRSNFITGQIEGEEEIKQMEELRQMAAGSDAKHMVEPSQVPRAADSGSGKEAESANVDTKEERKKMAAGDEGSHEAGPSRVPQAADSDNGKKAVAANIDKKVGQGLPILTVACLAKQLEELKKAAVPQSADVENGKKIDVANIDMEEERGLPIGMTNGEANMEKKQLEELSKMAAGDWDKQKVESSRVVQAADLEDGKQAEAARFDKKDERGLHIPLLPVQTVEAVAAAAKGSVASIKQLLNPFNYSTNPFSGLRTFSEQEVENDEAAAGDGQEQDERVVVKLTDDGQPIAYKAGTKLSCPVCDKAFELGQLQELNFHVEEHIKMEFTCPVCDAVFALDLEREFQDHVSMHFRDEEEDQVACSYFLFENEG